MNDMLHFRLLYLTKLLLPLTLKIVEIIKTSGDVPSFEMCVEAESGPKY